MEGTNDDIDEQPTDQIEDQEAERTDWKAKAIELEAKWKAEVGSRKRVEKDLKQFQTKASEAQTQSQPQDKKESKGFDYGQLAYLTANGITDSEDHQFLESVAKESGVELKDLLAKQWVQAELKERKDHRMAEAAIPQSGNRAQQSPRDSVDYWISKGELPPAENVELRRKVVNAKIEREKSKDTGGFGNAPEITIK